MKIDLQIHSTYSDGHETPEEICKLAKQHNISTISITDHDTVSEQKRIAQSAREAGVGYVYGVEVSTKWNDKTIHVLGYGYDPDNQELNSLLGEISEYRRNSIVDQFDILNENLKNDSKKSADRDKYKDKSVAYFSLPGLVRFIFEEGIIEDFKDGFQYLKGIKNTVPNIAVASAINLIHKAKGKSVISHPLAPRISIKAVEPERSKQEEIIRQLKEVGLDGLEVYSTGHGEDDINFGLQMCSKYSLIFTAGSDWHGSIKEIGESIKEFLPYYLDEFGDLQLSPGTGEKIVGSLS